MSLLRSILILIIWIPFLVLGLLFLAVLIEIIHEVTGSLLKVIRFLEELYEFHKWHYPWQRKFKKIEKKEKKEKKIDPEWQKEFINRQRALRNEIRNEHEKKNKGATK